jgi:Uncharacterized protein conserved in archaea (DUF2180)
VNCFDCAAHGQTAPAVAVCADCGAALCHDHAHVTARAAGFLYRADGEELLSQLDPVTGPGR